MAKKKTTKKTTITRRKMVDALVEAGLERFELRGYTLRQITALYRSMPK